MEKKKFKNTLVGSSLIALAGQFNPVLGNVLKGTSSIGEAIEQIGKSDAGPSEKIMLQEFALKQYEAEVADRATARAREAKVAESGGSDMLFKTIGIGITISFLAVVAYGLGIIPSPETADKDFLMFASGSVTSAFMAVVSYYFGSSSSSRHKTAMIMDKS